MYICEFQRVVQNLCMPTTVFLMHSWPDEALTDPLPHLCHLWILHHNQCFLLELRHQRPREGTGVNQVHRSRGSAHSNPFLKSPVTISRSTSKKQIFLQLSYLSNEDTTMDFYTKDAARGRHCELRQTSLQGSSGTAGGAQDTRGRSGHTSRQVQWGKRCWRWGLASPSYFTTGHPLLCLFSCRDSLYY